MVYVSNKVDRKELKKLKLTSQKFLLVKMTLTNDLK